MKSQMIAAQNHTTIRYHSYSSWNIHSFSLTSSLTLQEASCVIKLQKKKKRVQKSENVDMIVYLAEGRQFAVK